MRNPLAAIKRDDGALDTGYLPFIDFEIFVNGLGGEEGTTAKPGVLSAASSQIHAWVDALLSNEGCLWKTTQEPAPTLICFKGFLVRTKN